MKTFVISILMLVIVFLSNISQLFADEWIDNWISQATKNTPNMFESQKRGYASAGNLSLRVKNDTDYLVSISPPRFRAGCGGIDMFFGSFSYLNEEYLMEKLGKIIEGGVATFVYDIAMSVLSEPIQKSMKSLEALIDRLNQLQIDDCKAAKGVAAYLKSTSSGEEQSEALSKFLVESGLSEFYQGAQDEHGDDNTEQVMSSKGVTVDDMTSGCPEQMKNVFFKDGSILVNVAKELDMPEAQTRIMSAIVGDVEIDGGKFKMLGPCYNDPSDIDALIFGEIITRDDANKCKQVTQIRIDGKSYASLYEWSHDMIKEIAEAMGNKSDLSESAQTFINGMPSPVYLMIANDVKAMGDLENVDAISGRLAYLCALSYAYAMSKGLLFNTYQLYHDALRIAKNQKGPEGGTCTQVLVDQPAGMINTLLSRLDSFYGQLDVAHTGLMQKLTQNYEQENLIEERAGKLRTTSFKQSGVP
jgi:conjugative transfer pilus assembly protein TraH